MMLGLFAAFVALLSFTSAQQINFKPTTGTRSLWLPYKTVSGVPDASILSEDKTNHRTTYVISCPSAQPDCALKPNLTLTEGTDLVRWESSTKGTKASGTVVIDCPLTNSPVTCHQNAAGGGNARSTQQILSSSDILYQAVDVTATRKETSTKGKTVTVTAKQKTTTSSTSSSTAGVQTTPAAPWAMGGTVGLGLIGLAAL